MGSNDWRLGNFRKTDRGLQFRRCEFKPDTHGAHDHCIGCWREFRGNDHPDAEHDGYLARAFDQNRWVCRDCWTEFHVTMGWTEEAISTL